MAQSSETVTASSSAPSTARSPKFISLRLKLLTGFTLIFSLVFSGAYYWFYRFAKASALGQIQETLELTMQGAVQKIDGDQLIALAKSGKPRADGYTDDRRYWQHVEWLATVEKIEPKAYVYTYRLAPEKPQEVVEFIGSGSAVNRRIEGAKFKERHQIKPEEKQFYLTGVQTQYIDLEPKTDPWGRWVSGTAPIRNSRGEIVAAIGIDFKADYVTKVEQDIRSSMVVAFTITYGTLFSLVYIVSGVLTKPIQELTDIAEQIGEGEYDRDLSYLCRQRRVEDEITTLAQVFELMVSKVRQREENLKQQVSELRIEIDQVKRQQKVKEIVDTDFFQDLQAKARALRQRPISEPEATQS